MGPRLCSPPDGAEPGFFVFLLRNCLCDNSSILVDDVDSCVNNNAHDIPCTPHGGLSPYGDPSGRNYSGHCFFIVSSYP